MKITVGPQLTFAPGTWYNVQQMVYTGGLWQTLVFYSNVWHPLAPLRPGANESSGHDHGAEATVLSQDIGSAVGNIWQRKNSIWNPMTTSSQQRTTYRTQPTSRPTASSTQ